MTIIYNFNINKDNLFLFEGETLIVPLEKKKLPYPFPQSCINTQIQLSKIMKLIEFEYLQILYLSSTETSGYSTLHRSSLTYIPH
jgi:hypothetical protein